MRVVDRNNKFYEFEEHLKEFPEDLENLKKLATNFELEINYEYDHILFYNVYPGRFKLFIDIRPKIFNEEDTEYEIFNGIKVYTDDTKQGVTRSYKNTKIVYDELAVFYKNRYEEKQDFVNLMKNRLAPNNP